MKHAKKLMMGSIQCFIYKNYDSTRKPRDKFPLRKWLLSENKLLNSYSHSNRSALARRYMKKNDSPVETNLNIRQPGA